MDLAPLSPAHRPALRAAEPAVWLLRGQSRQLRGEARALLRSLLADYLGMAPAQLPLHFVPGQTPVVAAQWQGMGLSLSMSYSQDLALVALCPGARIGVDMTAIAPMPDWAQVARLYLGPASVARLAACAAEARDTLFALAWAELEARGKCLGLGLQEWSPARHERLQERSIQVSAAALDGLPSGQACALAVTPWCARNSVAAGTRR